LLKPTVETFFFYYLWEELPENDLYIAFAINYFFKKQRSNNPCYIYSISNTNFHWMEQDFVEQNPVKFSSDYFAYLCIPASLKKNVICGSISPSTTNCRNQLQNRTLPAASQGWKA
jgi:hypothetical protein